MTPRPPMAPSAVDPSVWRGGLESVVGLTDDSRKVLPGFAFALCPKNVEERERWAQEASAKGASTLFRDPADGALLSEIKIRQYPVPGLRSELSRIASEFYGDPSEALQVFGVTGTNGKTSCSSWVAQALTDLHRPCGLIGTLGAGYPGRLETTGYTTPGPIEVQSWLHYLKKTGATSVAMEVSSHALTEARVDAVKFDVALFTNLTHDHLDYHGSVEVYAEVKSQLFYARGLKTAVINLDDELGRKLASQLDRSSVELVTYSAEGREADYRAVDVTYHDAGFQFSMQSPLGAVDIDTPLSGSFNVANLLGVAASLNALGVSYDRLPSILARLEAPAGRMETLHDPRGVRVIIDYAHTPDALEKVLQSLRHSVKGRLIAVFGCGGNRDSAKRPVMGAVAEKNADLVILTSDNPRGEDPVEIMESIASGMNHEPYGQMLDRAIAIRQAIALALPGDVILVAGKGHERFQEISGVRHPFSDRAVVEQSIAGLGAQP